MLVAGNGRAFSASILAGALVFLVAPVEGRAQGTASRADSAVITRSRDDAANQSGQDDPQRVDESYQARGVEMGQFLVFPVLDVSAAYNDNLFATKANAKGDFLTRIAPEVRVRSRFKSHALNARGRVEQFVHRKYSSDNRLDAVLQVDGRYDIQRSWEAFLFADANQLHEDRGSPDDAGGKTPTNTRNFTARAGTKADIGRFGLTGEVSVARRVFYNVETSAAPGFVNNRDRDRVELQGLAQASYEIFPGYSAEVEVEADRRSYDDRVDDFGFDRSSTGYAVRSGVGVDISQLIRGDFLVGFTKQDYDDTRLTDPSGLSLRADFNWTPSRMTVVVPSLERAVYESTQAGVSGLVRTGGSLTVRHELQRNVVLTAIASISNDEFRGRTRSDWNYDGRLRGHLALTPNLYVGGEFGYRKRVSNEKTNGFDQRVVLLRVGAQI